MRKEILGILIFFLVIFVLVSLLTFDPNDPSIHHASGNGDVKNLFGITGAHTAGMLIGLFGVGAFWIPIWLMLASIHFFGDSPPKVILISALGALLLVVTTGSLLTFHDSHLPFFGDRISSGGVIGLPVKSFFTRYFNNTGGFVILCILWLIGFIVTTGFSLRAFSRRTLDTAKSGSVKVREKAAKIKAKRHKARKRTQIKAVQATTPKQKIEIKTTPPMPVKKVATPKQDVFEFMRKETGGYQFPSSKFLDDPQTAAVKADDENLLMQSKLLEKKLDDFGVKGKVAAVTPGPVITTFEYAPAPGIKINRIVNLTDDLALALRATSIRIVAPIPGKAAIGIEIPNSLREIVKLKDIIITETFEQSKSKLTVCLGKDIIGEPVVAELDKMPHLLIAGATGAGKSVGLNTMICSLLYKSGPEDIKFIMIDPKRIELSIYDGIPHLITPVVTDAKKATNALFWAVREMEARYERLSEQKVRNINQYNKKILRKKKDDGTSDLTPLPFIVIVIDELADLMMVASRDVEVALTRLAQMARAAGIHLILATQRPSVDVLTGIIKANFPTRLTFQVSSKTDSRTIIDANGAENLLGNGDMLFLPPGVGRLQRIHGAYISEDELTRITEFLKQQKKPQYDDSVTATPVEDTRQDKTEKDYDERYDDAVVLVTEAGQASISMVQRHLRIGYNRAARIIEMMESEGIIGPADGAKPREVLVRNYKNIP